MEAIGGSGELSLENTPPSRELAGEMVAMNPSKADFPGEPYVELVVVHDAIL